jgi:proteasome lid subunit RPN8/RPN11
MQASEECKNRSEEEGGVILNKDDYFEFIKIKNAHADTSVAFGLYETDLSELSMRVFPKIAEGWKMYASFHTHPTFSPVPSSIDMTKLFQGFKYNIIFSPIKDMFSYSFWNNEESLISYIPKSTITQLVNK